MVKFTAVLLTLLLFAAPATARDEEACNADLDVPVTVNPAFDDPRYDFTRDLAAVQAIAGDPRHSIPQYHAVTMGITRYEPVLEFHVPVLIETPPQGLACAHVQSVDVTVGYRDVTVFIASDIPPNSCGFNETLAHEQKHIAVNRELLNEFVPVITERFKSYLRLSGAFRVTDADYAQQILNQKLKAIMNETVDQMETENIRRQREVDSEEEYDRLAHVCDGDLTRIADRYRRAAR